MEDPVYVYIAFCLYNIIRRKLPLKKTKNQKNLRIVAAVI